MEFDHVGAHCSLPDCRRQDFLPFKCSKCSQIYCTEHYKFEDHNCISIGQNDYICTFCDLCNVTLKHEKNENKENVLQNHYKVCPIVISDKPLEKKRKEYCPNSHCQIVFGPSNFIICKICNQKVCISHRSSDQHPCKPSSSTSSSTSWRNSSMRENFINKYESRVANQTNTTTNTNTSTNNNNNNKSTSKYNESNKILLEAAKERERKKNTTINSTSNSSTNSSTSINSNNIQESLFSCPFCLDNFTLFDTLQSHINSIHPDPSSTSTSTSLPTNTTSTNGQGREVCPICQLRFIKVEDLVAHYETHSNTGTSNTNTNNSNCLIN